MTMALDRFSLADNEIGILCNEYDLPKPPVGTTPGTVSIYRHGPHDILMSEDLLNLGSDKQIRKVSAHEFYHYLQQMSGKNMNIKPVRELEAESMALDWIAGNRPTLPFISRPADDYRNISSKRDLTFNFNPAYSSCGFDSTDASFDDGFFPLIKKLLGGNRDD